MTQWINKTIICVLVIFALPSTGHLMRAQHGTLNVVGNGVFMTLSLPVSGFKGIDNDYDGRLSHAEYQQHQGLIKQQINNNLTFVTADSAKPLQGLLLSPVLNHNDPTKPFDQIVVMGRYSLNGEHSSAIQYKFTIALFGHASLEQKFNITSTNSETGQTFTQELNTLVPGATFLFDKQYKALSSQTPIRDFDRPADLQSIEALNDPTEKLSDNVDIKLSIAGVL